jgi:hypothetical protein
MMIFVLFYDFPMGYMSFDDFPMLPSGVWVYYILLPNQEDSIDSVLVCNPSGKEVPALA